MSPPSRPLRLVVAATAVVTAFGLATAVPSAASPWAGDGTGPWAGDLTGSPSKAPAQNSGASSSEAPAPPSSGDSAAESGESTTADSGESTSDSSAKGQWTASWWPSTRMGMTVFENSGESTAQATARMSRTFGRLGVIRHFAPGLPQPWSWLNSSYGNTPLVISFRAQPSQVLAGRYDSQLRAWFRDAPREYVTRWSYMHEPEDDHERGQLNPDLYRRAWQHIARLADSVGNSRLRATLILMCWTIEPNSGRNWQTYYPGSSTIDLMAYDCYNAGHRKNTYRSPADLLEHAPELAQRLGKPWGIAELGSVVVGGDNGAGRATWLRGAAKYAREHHARFITYFNSDVGTDYRLHDRPSQDAWREVVAGQYR